MWNLRNIQLKNYVFTVFASTIDYRSYSHSLLSQNLVLEWRSLQERNHSQLCVDRSEIIYMSTLWKEVHIQAQTSATCSQRSLWLQPSPVSILQQRSPRQLQSEAARVSSAEHEIWSLREEECGRTWRLGSENRSIRFSIKQVKHSIDNNVETVKVKSS